MSNRLLLAAVVAAALAALANAQSTETNPAQAPNVYLDNHRPLIKKKEKAPTARTVSGKVVDDTGQPLGGAIVTLTNTKTKNKTQVITKNDGRYNFEDVSFDIDYELQARYKASLSDTRKLSQYDRMASAVRILQIDPDSNSPNTEAKKETPPETKK
jgi:Carboxypeptidase regulatory-like domain